MPNLPDGREATMYGKRGMQLRMIPVMPDILFEIRDDEDRMLVRLKKDATMEFGPTYEPDEAARQFWETMRAYGLRYVSADEEPMHKLINDLREQVLNSIPPGVYTE